MTDWKETAKRLAVHPEFEYQPGMALARISNGVVFFDAERWPWRTECEDRTGHEHFPDLTDWATVGVLLGMICEYTRVSWQVVMKRCAKRWLTTRIDCGQALAELLLELWGEG